MYINIFPLYDSYCLFSSWSWNFNGFRERETDREREKERERERERDESMKNVKELKIVIE
jgi:hypothetical protein